LQPHIVAAPGLLAMMRIVVVSALMAVLWSSALAADSQGHGAGGAHSAAGEGAGPALPRAAKAQQQEFERKQALDISQGVIGNTLGDHRFIDSRGQQVSLADFRGKPLVISLIYTSCYHICPTTTSHLYKKAVANAQSVLGRDSFQVVTLGFDVANDTPEALATYARERGLDTATWPFLAADQGTIDALARELGFLYYASPRGFDHLIQTSIIDGEGRVYRQVYGIEFELPHLIEPLKGLIFGTSREQGMLDNLSNRVKLFCTVYDPATGKYAFSYAIFVGLFVGLTVGGLMILVLVREWRNNLRSGKDQAGDGP